LAIATWFAWAIRGQSGALRGRSGALRGNQGQLEANQGQLEADEGQLEANQGPIRDAIRHTTWLPEESLETEYSTRTAPPTVCTIAMREVSLATINLAIVSRLSACLWERARRAPVGISREPEVIRASQSSSELIRAHQGSSGLIRAHQRLS